MSHSISPLKAGKKKVAQVLNQAKDSLRILETLEKEALAKAKSWIRVPNAQELRKLRKDRILSGLKKIGVATRQEVDSLSEKVLELESAIKPARKKSSSQTASSKKKPAKKTSK